MNPCPEPDCEMCAVDRQQAEAVTLAFRAKVYEDEARFRTGLAGLGLTPHEIEEAWSNPQ